MNKFAVILLCLFSCFSVFSAEKKESVDPTLLKLKEKLEKVTEKLKPKPTFTFPEDMDGKCLVVKYKTKTYYVHHYKNKLGQLKEKPEKEVGPDKGGFFVSIRLTNHPNQLQTPQVCRRPYWYCFVNEFPFGKPGQLLSYYIYYNRFFGPEYLDFINKIKDVINEFAPPGTRKGKIPFQKPEIF